MSQNSENPPDRDWITTLAGSYLILLYVALCVLILVFGYRLRAQIPFLHGSLPTQTAAATAIPTPLPAATTPQINEAFANNDRNWSIYYAGGKVEVKDHQLALDSYHAGDLMLSYCAA